MYKLSVIIPIYNAKKYLEKCLETVIVNDDEIEFILIDDGSEDGSNYIYNKYNSIKNVTLKKNENHGVSYTRNYGIDISKGKYIMFVDADDFLKNNWNEIVKSEINDNLDEDIIIFSKEYDCSKYEKRDLQNACLQYRKNSLSNCSIMSPFSKIYNKEFIIKNNIRFNSKIINGEDMLFNFEAISLTDKIKIINKGIYIYRINYNSVTNNFNKKIFESDINFHIKLKELVLKSNFDENVLDYLIINAIYILAIRLSFSNENKKEVILKKILDNDIYLNKKKKYKIIKNEYSLFERMILDLIFNNEIKLTLEILKIKSRIKRMKKTKNEVIKLKEI